MKVENTIEKEYLPFLGRIFNTSVIDSIALKGHSDYLREICENSGLLNMLESSITLSQFFDWIYNILFKNYRNEYIYKNVIANKILLGRYSLNTTKLLTEFRIGKNKADVVLLNGDFTVYEIKSQYDSLKRLDKQLETYFKIFDYINIITSPFHISKVKSYVPEEVGILVLTDKNSISTIRKPKMNRKNINCSLLFDSLRKDEYLKIIEEYYNEIPDVPNTRIFKECKTIFCKMPFSDMHNLTLGMLKKRKKSENIKEFINKAPSSLSGYIMSICEQRKKIQKLSTQLNKNIYSILY